MNVRRLLCVALALLGSSCVGFAQEGPLRKGATEITLWGGGGSGLGHSDSTQMYTAGVRLGKILTEQHGNGLLRGNLEYAFDITPLYLFRQDKPVAGANGVSTQRETVYGGSISPLIVKWNFTRGKRVVPFVAVEGSAIFTTKDVPSGDTSTVNFGSGLASGVQVLRGNRSSLSFSGHLMHISNASLGNHNPGLNVALQFRVGYQWWK